MTESPRGHRPEKDPQLAIYKTIPEVPFIQQEHINWCGYAGVSMLLQRRGFQVTPEELFYRANPDITDIYDIPHRVLIDIPGPSYSHLAAIAKDIVGEDYTVGLFHNGKYKNVQTRTYKEKGNYEDYKKKIKGFTPYVLLETLLKGDNPAMIRLKKHNVVIAGMGTDSYDNRTYHVLDPLKICPIVESKAKIDHEWGYDDEKQFITGETDAVDGILPVMSSKYLMMAIYPSRKARAAKRG